MRLVTYSSGLVNLPCHIKIERKNKVLIADTRKLTGVDNEFNLFSDIRFSALEVEFAKDSNNTLSLSTWFTDKISIIFHN